MAVLDPTKNRFQYSDRSDSREARLALAVLAAALIADSRAVRLEEST
jgi:hypothetical protein